MARALAAAPLAYFALFLFVLPAFLAGRLPGGLLEALANTAAAGGIASSLALLSALAVAFAGRGSKAVEALGVLLYVPQVVPLTAVGVLLLASLGSLRALGLGLDIVNTFWGVVYAMYVPSTGAAYIALTAAARDTELDHYLATLGLGTLARMKYFLLAMRRAVAVALLAAVLRAFGELGTLLVVAQSPTTLAIYIYNAWQVYGVGEAVSASLVVMALGGLLAYLYARYAVR